MPYQYRTERQRQKQGPQPFSQGSQPFKTTTQLPPLLNPRPRGGIGKKFEKNLMEQGSDSNLPLWRSVMIKIHF